MKATVRAEVERGRALTSSQLIRATQPAGRARRAHALAFFDRYDYLACPVTQVEPFPVEQEYAAEVDGVRDGLLHRVDALQLAHQRARCCPAISVPVGFSAAGLPVGLQLVARPFGERALLEVAHALELRRGLAAIRRMPASSRSELARGASPRCVDLAPRRLGLRELLDAELALDARRCARTGRPRRRRSGSGCPRDRGSRARARPGGRSRGPRARPRPAPRRRRRRRGRSGARRRGACRRPSISAMNWSPMSMNAAPGTRPRSSNAKRRP